MDYRYYQGAPLIKNPELRRKIIPLLKPIGITMCILSWVFPWMMILHILKTTYFLSCVVTAFQLGGVILWVYGHSREKVSRMDDEELSEEILEYYNQKRNKKS